MTESTNWVEKEAGIDGSGMAHSTWRDTAILSFPSFVFNLLFCVVLNLLATDFLFQILAHPVFKM